MTTANQTPPAPTPVAVGHRLAAYPMDKAIPSLYRSRNTDPARTIGWFLLQEAKPEAEFAAAYNGLDSSLKVMFRELQEQFEGHTSVGRQFKHHTTSTNPAIDGNFTDIDGNPITAITASLTFYTRAIIEGRFRSLVVAGSPGIGKTVTVMKTLANAFPDIDTNDPPFIRLTGRVSPMGLFCFLRDNKDKIIVMDDLDSLFTDSLSVSILRAALETTEHRTITWASRSLGVTLGNNQPIATPAVPQPQQPGQPPVPPSPRSFDFTGSIIFLTNLNPSDSKNETVRALMSRTLSVRFSFDRLKIMHYLEVMADQILTGLTPPQRSEVLDHIRSRQFKLRILSLRTLLFAQGVYQTDPSNWKTFFDQLD